MRIVYLALLMVAVAPCIAAAQSAPTDDEVAAIAMPEPQLRSMLARTVFGTQTLPMAMFTLGIQPGCAVVKPAFEAAVAKVMPRWRANLIKAYRDNVPANALGEAVRGPVADSAVKLAAYRPIIGTAMQTASQPLLKEAGELVLTAASTAASKADASKVEGQKRMNEMKQAQADGSLLCGLLSSGAAN